MKRREILSNIKFLPLAFFLNCSKDSYDNPISVINGIQEEMFNLYNNGEIDEIFGLFSDFFFYADGSMRADNEVKAKKHLNAVHDHHIKNRILPITIKSQETYSCDDIAWSNLELASPSRRSSYGFLTQIFRKNSSEWKIIHHHFSHSRSAF